MPGMSEEIPHDVRGKNGKVNFYKYKCAYECDNMDVLNVKKKVVRSGGSLCLRMTKEFELMDVREGDSVEISVRKIQ